MLDVQTVAALALVALAAGAVGRRVWRGIVAARVATRGPVAGCGDGCGCAAPSASASPDTAAWDEVAPAATRSRVG